VIVSPGPVFVNAGDCVAVELGVWLGVLEGVALPPLLGVVDVVAGADEPDGVLVGV